jgi:hypoxanthine phosphoribosyltransferase
MTSDDKHIEIELLSESTVTALCRTLARQIQDSGYAPDIVVAIARGGYVPARYLCDYLNLYDLTSFRISHYTGARKSGETRLSDPLGVDIRGLSVLLVDDVDDSGDTLQLALSYLRGFEPEEVRVAVLHHKLSSTVLPDYFAHEVVHWRWLVYPWAVTEDVLGFVNRMHPSPMTVDEAIERMQADYHVSIPVEVMDGVFRLR